MKLRALAILAFGAFLTACSCDPEPAAVICTQPGSVKDFCENVGDRVYFDFDRSNIGPCAKQTLENQAKWLLQYPQYEKITIVGNCDERGSTAYNMGLGARRAEAAKRVLVAAGVPSCRIETCSQGKERPVAQGSNEAAWAENRNAITLLCSSGSAPAEMTAPMSSEAPAEEVAPQ